MTISTMPPAMPATAMPFGMSSRRGQQTGGYRSRDQQGFKAHHGYHPFICAVDRENLDQAQRTT
jgi:hypothetical protein